MIRIQGLSKLYKQRRALAGVELHIAAGELFGLVGTNGAGRTTLLNILATLIKATTGQVEIAGFDALKRPLDVRRRIGYVSESPAFYEDVQVRDYLDFAAAARGLAPPRKTEAIEIALARCTIEPTSLIGTLSKGCRQQLALAAALLHDPMVLLLDEPATHLDPLAQQRLHDLLQERHAQGTTILMACNTAPDLQRLCHRIGFLHQGHLLEIRHPVDTVFDPAGVLRTLIETNSEGGSETLPTSGNVT